MNLRAYESPRTRSLWPSGWGNPSLLILLCLLINLINLIVMIAINLTVANEPLNDYGENFGWILFAPAPAAGFLWALIDVVLCIFWVMHPIAMLVEGVLLGCLNFVYGGLGVAFYEWDSEGSWVAGMFIVFAGVWYIGVVAVCARVVHLRNKGRARGKNIEAEARV